MLSRKKAASKHEVDIRVDHVLTTSFCSKLIAELIKFLMFSRGQISTPYDQLDKTVQEVGEALRLQDPLQKKRVPRVYKRLSKFTTSVHQLLESASSPTLHCLGCSCACLGLGASSQRAKELYIIKFLGTDRRPVHLRHDCASCDEAGDTDMTAQAPYGSAACQQHTKQQKDAVRKVLRTLVMAHATIPEWEGVPPPTKIFLLLQGAASLPEAPPGFLPKQGLVLNRQGKATQVTLNIISNHHDSTLPAAPHHDDVMSTLSEAASALSLHTPSPPDMQLAEADPGSADVLWYQSTSMVKGLPQKLVE